MLISRVPEEDVGRGDTDAEMARNCQTASELFELMTKDHDFESGDDPLTTNDLVLLYKNIDLGNQLMSSVRGRPNQYVENVYHDDPETDSDLSESCSSEELRNIMLTNKERIDLFATPPSLNSLCHKLGDLEIQVSNISNDLYDDRYFLHNDPYIKNQLQNLQLLTTANEINSALFPTSLLDYICCQRLDYNYSSHMENIITYVKHTIDQLKRISNGDYLPDKVKEKWRETKHDSGENTLKGLATSIGMPLQMKQKATRLVTAWDDIVHTEMGLQSLVKIMERKIVLEVPRSISDTFAFFSKYRSDDKLVISCSQRKSKSRERARSAPRVDVVLRAGQLVSHIGSLMLLQPDHRIADKGGTVILPLESIPIKSPELLTSKVMELTEIDQNFENKPTDNSEEYSSVNVTPNAMELSEIQQNFENKSSHNFGGSSSISVIPNVTEPCAIEEKFENKSSDKSDEYSSVCSFLDTGYCRTNHSEVTSIASKSYSTSGSLQAGSPEEMALILSTANRVMRAEAAANHATPNDLNFCIKSFENQASLLDENTLDTVSSKTKKKSPERVRIKSPYENKSHILEERRRKRLLEIRERRERRKMASKENSKFIKPKSLPQAVSSVTKLSFTNKAFYDSIYGRNGNGDNTKRVSAVNNSKERKGTQKIDGVIQEDQESDADVKREESFSEITLKKLCKNDILDDTETEMSYLQSKQDGDFLKISTTTSVNSNESTTNLCNHSEYCSSLNFLVNEQFSPTVLGKLRDDEAVETLKSQDPLNKDTANATIVTKDDSETEPAIECRRSIEKIYTLMKKLQEIETSETAKKKITFSESRGLKSESGSSLKRRVSFSKPNRSGKHTNDFQNERDEDIPMASVPKVVISAKLQPRNSDEKKEHKMRPPRIRTVPENPLKAISQLLHEFDNVQKSKSQVADPRSINRSVSTENTEQPAKVQKKRARIESPVHNAMKVAAKVKTRFGREARVEEKGKPRVPDKKITDLIDEVKEARGEAVRGPPRFSSRLNALAQPRRAYVPTAELPKRAYVQTTELPKRPYVQAAELPKRAFVHAAELTKRQPLESAHRPASHTPRARARGSPTSVRPPHSSLERTRSGKPRRSAAGSPQQDPRDPPPFASLAAAATVALHSLKEKMVAKEPADGCCVQRSSPSRVPVMPRDIQMSSSSSSTVDESPGSFSIGSQLHRMVNDMLLKDRHSSPARSPSCLTTAVGDILNEATTVTEEVCIEETEIEEVISEKRHGNEPDDQLDKAMCIITPANSVTEIAMLEHALHRSLSSGAFGGRLRVNKLTLSPRPSLQRVVMQQSGDTTLVIKSDSYQEIQVNCHTSNEIDLIELLSKTRLNSELSGFPLQISTVVGYAFPTYECEINDITPKIVNTEAIETSDAGTSYMSSATTMLEIKDRKEKTVCQCPMAGARSSKECVNKQVCTGVKNVDTSPATVVLASPADVANHYKNVPSCEHEENDQPSYTSSFDILVGLLNEIQKITTCGTEAASAQTLESERESSPRESSAPALSSKCTESNVCEQTNKCFSLFISNSNISSDDQLGFYIPETQSMSGEALKQKPARKDKEVLARVTMNAAASTARQAGLPNDTATSTCTMNAPTKSCSVSGFSVSEYSDKGCNTSFHSDDKIIDHIGIQTSRTSVKSLVPYYNNMCKGKMKKHVTVSSENTATQKHVTASCDTVSVQNRKKEVTTFTANADYFDSTLKVKRDILVTFYSILVLTVFAALAVPEILQFA